MLWLLPDYKRVILPCHHSSSDAFVTCKISPYLNAKPLLGNPESLDGS